MPDEGGDTMGKIFRISGIFGEIGKERDAKPSIKGLINVDDDDNFFGYCDESCPIYEELGPDLRNEYGFRFLAGSFANNGKDKKRGMCFYVMSNSTAVEPILCLLPRIEEPENGTYFFIGPFNIFLPEGEIHIELEEVEFSVEKATEIIDTFVNLDTKKYMNDSLLNKQFKRCRRELEKYN